MSEPENDYSRLDRMSECRTDLVRWDGDRAKLIVERAVGEDYFAAILTRSGDNGLVRLTREQTAELRNVLNDWLWESGR